MRRRGFALAVLIAATSGDMVENPRSYSADRRFCLVLRQHERLGDFDAKPVNVVFGWDEPRDENEIPEPPDHVVGALYDGNHLLSEIVIPARYNDEEVLISDSGAYVVARAVRTWPNDDPIAAIFRADGTLVRELRERDLLTQDDLDLRALMATPRITLRDELLIAAVPASFEGGVAEELRVDLATGALLDQKHDIYPSWRAWATSAAANQALFRPDPAYPVIARKAHISGTVIVEVDVNEHGTVTETRVLKPLPFGMDKAAEAAAKQWVFMPGEPTIADIEFHFGRINGAEWKQIIDAR